MNKIINFIMERLILYEMNGILNCPTNDTISLSMNNISKYEKQKAEFLSTILERLEGGYSNEVVEYEEIDKVVEIHSNLINSLQMYDMFGISEPLTNDELIEIEERRYEEVKQRHEKVFKEYYGRNSDYNCK